MAISFVKTNSNFIALPALSSAFQKVNGASLSIWLNAASAPSANMGIFSFSTGTSASSNRMSLYTNLNLPAYVNVRCADTDALQTPGISINNVLTLNVWHHFAASCDFINQVCSIVVDGVVTYSNVTLAGLSLGPTSNTPSLAAAIGGPTNGAGSLFDGLLSDARAYNRALSQAEMQSIFYAKGNDCIVNGLVHRFIMKEYTDLTVMTNTPCALDVGALSLNGTPKPAITLPHWASDYIRTGRIIKL